MPIYLTESDVDATLSMDDAIRLVDRAARRLAEGSAANAPRVRVSGGDVGLHVLAAGLDGRVGHKTYSVGARGARFWFTLFAASGEMLAIIEAERMGQLRTGAASGVATHAMARPDARTLGVIGTGYQAQTQVEAVCAVRRIDRIAVFGRDPRRRERFCQDLRARLGCHVEAAASAEDAVEGADVVITMTKAAEPVVDGEALAPGVHVNAAGSNRANAREIDAALVRRADVIAVEDLEQAKVESGDLIGAAAEGAFAWDDAVRLGDIIAGRMPGRRNAGEITLFESLGIGLWDIAVGAHVYEACRAAGRGMSLPFIG